MREITGFLQGERHQQPCWLVEQERALPALPSCVLGRAAGIGTWSLLTPDFYSEPGMPTIGSEHKGSLADINQGKASPKAPASLSHTAPVPSASCWVAVGPQLSHRLPAQGAPLVSCSAKPLGMCCAHCRAQASHTEGSSLTGG